MDSSAKQPENTEEIKIVLLGHFCVGKTSILRRFIRNEYNGDPGTTMSFNQEMKVVVRGRKTLELFLFDPNCRARLFAMVFCKDANIIIFVYNITYKKSFEDIKNIWYEDFKKLGKESTVLAVVGTMSDLYKYKEVDEDSAREFAKGINAIFMLVSAKTGDNINSLFDTVVDDYLRQKYIREIQIVKQIEESESEMKNLRKNNKNLKRKKLGH